MNQTARSLLFLQLYRAFSQLSTAAIDQFSLCWTVGVGFAAALLGICFATYYSVLMAWSWIYFIGSFKTSLPWEADTDALAEAKVKPPIMLFVTPKLPIVVALVTAKLEDLG